MIAANLLDELSCVVVPHEPSYVPRPAPRLVDDVPARVPPPPNKGNNRARKRRDQYIDLLRSRPGITVEEIREALGVTRGGVDNMMSVLREAELVTFEQVAGRRRWRLR